MRLVQGLMAHAEVTANYSDAVKGLHRAVLAAVDVDKRVMEAERDGGGRGGVSTADRTQQRSAVGERRIETRRGHIGGGVEAQYEGLREVPADSMEFDGGGRGDGERRAG